MKNNLKITIIGFIGVLALISCKKKTSETSPAPNTGPAITAKYYFKGTVNNKSVLIQSGVGGYYNGVVGEGSNKGTEGENYLAGNGFVFFDITAKSSQSINVNIVKYFLNKTPKEADFDGMFVVGDYLFGNSEQLKDGVEIEYVDENKKTWSSNKGTGSQTGSVFKLKSRIPYTNYYTPIDITGSFSCKLYDDAGNMIELKDGEYSSLAGYYND
jgi:hypothetical protein